MSDPKEYTIGWISAIHLEYVSAQVFLDENHGKPSWVHPEDKNNYILGTIHDHKVALTVLSAGQHGVVSASLVASQMRLTFPNLRICLMVGIGGGVPSDKHDIRLGDVVISLPTSHKQHGNLGGVIQYDYGKTIREKRFQSARFLNEPPRVLLNAVQGLRTKYEIYGNEIDASIITVLEKYPRLKGKYSRPDPKTDKLYSYVKGARRDDTHESTDGSVASEPSLIVRTERTDIEDNPAIHYGLIASADTFMNDAQIRDTLSRELNVLCFEMEAAGIMNDFPCLVIRGICDYADEHSSKEWQGFAAMTASACAKDLLQGVVAAQVEAEKKIADVLLDLYQVAEAHREIAQEQLQAQKDFAEERLSKEQQKCHQLFRLTSGANDTPYEQSKDRVEERVEDTCLWFLQHKHFETWLKQESGPLLVTADPGCGKSVLARYLVDHYLRHSTTIYLQSPIICYFFFKDQDQNTFSQALCAILHQLFDQMPSLITHALPEFRKNGKGLVDATESLWRILQNAIGDSKVGPAIIVLDALDECAELELEVLMRNVSKQFSDDRPSKVKYLLTCRPYNQIVSKFHGLLKKFPNIHIPGEEESEIISQEVNHVITHRINQFPTKDQTTGRGGLSPEIKRYLEKRLQEATHRTYLWVYLVFDYLEKEGFKKTKKGVDAVVQTLPKSINEAYEKILNRSREHPMVRKALQIILAATRPLTLSEMNVAINIEEDDTSHSIDDLDLEDEEDFKSRLRSWCGLFILIYNGKIYFLHQTAREFLLADSASSTTISAWSTATLPAMHWGSSITMCQAHTVLATACVFYLNFFNSDIGHLIDMNDEIDRPANRYALLDYSAKAWGIHFREADITENNSIIPHALIVCDPDSRTYAVWFRIYWETLLEKATDFTNLTVASYFGHVALVKKFLDKGAKVEARDSQYGRTSLLWAALNGHDAVVELLLEDGANIETKDIEYDRTPLSWAAQEGHEAVAKLLLVNGANIEAKDMEYDRTPLWWAAGDGRDGIVKLLLENDANVEIEDKYHRTPLSWAAQQGHEAVVKLLLVKGANIEAKDRLDRTPLSWAAGVGHAAVAKLLLENGAELEARDKYDWTPLWWTAGDGREAVAKLLLEKGADPDAKDATFFSTPLQWATRYSLRTLVKLLLENGANVEGQDKEHDRTPLSWAAGIGDEVVVNLLLDSGADIEAKDNDGQTPLSWASRNGHVAVVKLLLEKGAAIDAKDDSGETPLSWARRNGHEVLIKLLQT